jgi:hypothetical protein
MYHPILQEQQADYSGVYLCLVLTVIGTVFKFCGVIDWSWWIVLAPVWFPLFCVVIILVGAIVVLIFR